MHLDRYSLLGGLQISLDMQKVFDSISRDVVIRALNALYLPDSIVYIIQSWLAPHGWLTTGQ